MTDKIILHLVQFNIIEEDDIEIYRFGLEGLMLKVLHYLSYAAIAFSFHIIPEFLLFFIGFTILRKNAGGFHAKTKKSCYIFSCLTVGLISACIKYMAIRQDILNILVAIILLIFCDLVICLIAPEGNRNRLLDCEEKQYFKIKTIRLLTLENLVLFFLFFMNLYTLIVPILLGIICEAMLLILEKFRNTDLDLSSNEEKTG